MKRNIKLLKFILPLNQAWFWLGIWILYYLRFTNYTGIGLIEAVVITTGFIFEIPTGALADLIGKKKTIIISFLFSSVGNIIMTFAESSVHLVISIVFLAIGGALLSGTSDALIYDSLKQIKSENKFEGILSSINKYILIIMAIASIIGGFMYKINPRIPFAATSIAMFIAFFIAFFLKEPKIDAIKFSFINYLKQIRIGVSQLFKEKSSIHWIIKLLAISSFAVIFVDILDGTLAIHFRFNERSLGILFALIPFISAVGNHFYLKIKSKIGEKKLLLFIFITFILITGISPIYGLFFGGISLLYRNFFYPFIDIMASNTINRFVESKYRTTTLSTFIMIKKLPYVLFAYIIGRSIDKISPSRVSLWFSILLGVLALILYTSSTYKAKFRKNKQ